MTILVVGDANADLSATLDQFPREGDDALVTSLGWGSGGSAANVATALARLGERARLLARVGNDPSAAIALQAARAAGVDLAAIQTDDTLSTGMCFAGISPAGERTLFSYRGANAALAPGDAKLLAGARWLHVAGHTLLEGRQRDTTLALIDVAAARGIPISLDACMPTLRAWSAETQALLPRLRVLFANELELAALAGLIAKDAEVEPVRHPLGAPGLLAIEDVLARGTGVVAAKLGPQGCVVARRGEQHSAPAFAVEAVDTTGSGDAFVAGFLFAYLRAQPLERCATFGNALGGLAATRSGAAEALPDRASARAFLAERQHPDLAALLDATSALPPRYVCPADGKEMVLVPAGAFVMGTTKSQRSDERPAHEVTLAAFYIDRTPVTIGEYLRFVAATGHKPPRLIFPGPRPLDYEQHPVTGVSWHDARAYADWAGKRLPSEAEWEKAASWDSATSTKRRYPWGDDWDMRRCNMLDTGLGHTTPVGFYSPYGDAPCGAADMAGNVFEWTASMDWHYPARPGDGRDALDQYGIRVRRGGAYTSEEVFMRTTTRQLSPPDGMFLADGFRCVVDADRVTPNVAE